MEIKRNEEAVDKPRVTTTKLFYTSGPSEGQETLNGKKNEKIVIAN